MISSETQAKLLQVLVSSSMGAEVVNALNAGQSLAGQSGFTIPAIIQATVADATTNFASLAVGDYVLHLPTISMAQVTVAGTNPAAAVIGDYYIVFRSWTAPASI